MLLQNIRIRCFFHSVLPYNNLHCLGRSKKKQQRERKLHKSLKVVVLKCMLEKHVMICSSIAHCTLFYFQFGGFVMQKAYCVIRRLKIRLNFDLVQ